MAKELTNTIPVHEALGHMVLPTHGRTTRSAEYWATQFDISVPMLSMICGGTRTLSVELLKKATKLTGDSLAIEALATDCGYVAFPVLQTEIPAGIPLIEQINDSVQQGAEAVRAICNAVKDGVVDDEERADVDRQLLEMIASFSHLRAMVHQLPRKAANVTPMRKATM